MTAEARTATAASREETRLPRTFAAFRHRNFRLFFIGQLISLIGTWMQNTAQGWLVVLLASPGAALGQKTTIFIEPCYEHCDDSTLLGLLRRRYIEVNDYNTNLVTLLHEESEAGKVKILDERKAAFGHHPLLAASVIVWEPADRT